MNKTPELTAPQQAFVEEAKSVAAILNGAGYTRSKRVKVQTYRNSFIRHQDGDYEIVVNVADFTITVYKYSKTGNHLNPEKFLPLLQGYGFELVEIDGRSKFKVLVAAKAGA
jgi:hypothetical protein